MATTLEICNEALGLIGADPIASLTEDSNEARWCNTQFARNKAALLSERAWSFAEAQLTLESPTESAWKDGWLYDIPANVLRIYRCYHEVGGTPRKAEWRRLGDKILAKHEGTVYAIGIMGDTDEAQFPELFSVALAARLASEMAVPIARSRQLQADLATVYQYKLRAAAASDGSEARSERTDTTQLTWVRGGGYTL